MPNKKTLLPLLTLPLLLNCTPPTPTPQQPTTQQPTQTQNQNQNQPYLNHPQPKLPTIKLWLGNTQLTAEIARTPTQIATGMMHRKHLPQNHAMLFIFNQPHRAAFYMRNTHIPLTCAYIHPDGTILELHNMTPHDETPITATSHQIQYVLETNQNWFTQNQIKPGTLITTPNGTLQTTFFPHQ